MPDADLLNRLSAGVAAWNENRPAIADLSHAKLSKRELAGVDFSTANLVGADMRGANLQGADLSDCDLRTADLGRADLTRATLRGARLNEANLRNARFADADLSCCDLSQVNGRGATFRNATLVSVAASQANFSDARFTGARMVGFDADSSNFRRAVFLKSDLTQAWLGHSDLTDADMRNATLSDAVLNDSKPTGVNLTSADLSRADLRQCSLVEAIVADCILSGSAVYGISAWGIKGTPRVQTDLLLLNRGPTEDASAGYEAATRVLGTDGTWRTPWPSSRLGIASVQDGGMPPDVRVDDLEVAQFVYLLLTREKLRNVIETITSKAVLILGRFTPERKVVLDAISAELRRHNLLPMMFDFERATTRDFTETIKTLAGMSLFVIVDITNPKSTPLELAETVPDYRIPFIPIIQEGEAPFSMFSDLMKYDWVAPLLTYSTGATLVKVFKRAVIDEANAIHQRVTMEKAQRLVRRTEADYLAE